MDTSSRPTVGHQFGMPGRLTFLVEQLWRPVLETGKVRARLAARDTPGWSSVETYRVLPSATKAAVLIPDAPLVVGARSLSNYRGLRRRTPNLQRGLLATATRAGIPLPFPRLRLQTSQAGAPDGLPILPLQAVANDLGLPEVFASLGINTSANRKVTLQVVDRTGQPVGFAKFSWGPVSAAAIASESAALRSLPGRRGPARAPEVLAAGDYHGLPYIVTAPIPLDSVGVRADVPAPSALELFSLAPVVRRAPIRETKQFRALRQRLVSLPADRINRAALDAAIALHELVSRSDAAVPVAAHWHGDLTPWNSARSGDGTLWCWDWESSEKDAIAALDAIHWHMAVRAEAGQLWDGPTLQVAVRKAAPMATAAGYRREMLGHISAVYAATITERACALAYHAGGWESIPSPPQHLVSMLATARRLVY